MNEINLFCFITNLFVVLLCVISFMLLPVLTRKTFLFGVRVPEEAQENLSAKALKRSYFLITVVGLSIILVIIVIQYFYFPELSLVGVMYYPLLMMAVQALAFIPNWLKAVKLKKENNWRVSTSVFAESRSSSSRGRLSQIPWIYYVVSLIVITGSAVALLIKYPNLPDPIATHFDINMQPDKWASKTIFTVMTMPLINLGMLTLMAGTAIAIVKTKLQVSSQNPQLSFAQHREYRKWMGHGMGILTIGLAIGLSLLSVGMAFPEMIISFEALMFILIIPVLPLTIISLRIGQGGCKLNPKITETDSMAAGYRPQTPVIAGRGDDKYWIFGTFYYNPDDPAFFVENRFGSKIGINYASPLGKITLILMAIMVIGLYIWVTPMLML